MLEFKTAFDGQTWECLLLLVNKHTCVFASPSLCTQSVAGRSHYMENDL